MQVGLQWIISLSYEPGILILTACPFLYSNSYDFCDPKLAVPVLMQIIGLNMKSLCRVTFHAILHHWLSKSYSPEKLLNWTVHSCAKYIARRITLFNCARRFLFRQLLNVEEQWEPTAGVPLFIEIWGKALWYTVCFL